MVPRYPRRRPRDPADLASVATVEGVKSLISPFTIRARRSLLTRAPGTLDCLQLHSHEAAAQKLAQAAATSQLNVQVGGTAFTKISPGDQHSRYPRSPRQPELESARYRRLLPIITGVAGVGVSSLAVILLSMHNAAHRRPRAARPIARPQHHYALFIVTGTARSCGKAAACRRVHHGDTAPAGRALRGWHRHRGTARPGHPQRRLPHRARRSRRGDRVPAVIAAVPCSRRCWPRWTACAAQLRARSERAAGTVRRRPARDEVSASGPTLPTWLRWFGRRGIPARLRQRVRHAQLVDASS